MLQEQLKSGEELYVQNATVVSVEKTKRTCNVEMLNGGGIIEDVNLQAIENGLSGICFYPLVGSVVSIAWFDKASALVVLCSEIEQVKMNTEELKIDIDKSGVGVNNKGKDLMTVLENLIDEIKAITVTTANGASGIPINGAKFDVIKNDFKTILKKI